MYRYRVQRFWTEFDLLTKDLLNKSNLSVMDLIPLDQYHYLGTSAVDLAAENLEISAESKVLDIGSGIGGTARYLAWKYKCHVTGVELQAQLHDVGIEMNACTNTSDQVKLLEGDFTDIGKLGLGDRRFDSWISLMVFLHISDRATVFNNCARVLKPNGRFYIEDYFAAKTLTATEQKNLAEVVACPYLPNRDRYIGDLEAAGFTDIEFTEVTELWQPWLKERADKFEQARDHYESILDLELVNSYSRFYQTVANLFAGGNLGGARISGRLA
jgi:sarcosine/dimethylglycine N-methyltransferase